MIVATVRSSICPSARFHSEIRSTQKRVSGNPKPVDCRLEIVNLPSASTLAILRRETSNRASGTEVWRLADPVFEETDQRVLAAISQNNSGVPAQYQKCVMPP